MKICFIFHRKCIVVCLEKFMLLFFTYYQMIYRHPTFCAPPPIYENI